MDAPTPELILAITGSWLFAQICRRIYVSRRNHYVAAADSRYAALQASLNASCWVCVFLAVATVLAQPALASRFGAPTGWAGLVSGTLVAAGVMLRPFHHLGVWLGTRRPDADLSGFSALQSGVLARARAERRVLLTVAPFFASAVALTVAQAGNTGRDALLPIGLGLLLGLVHVGSSMSAVISWRALSILQREMRRESFTTSVEDIVPETGAAAALGALDIVLPGDPEESAVTVDELATLIEIIQG